jgi:hypothetical protein
VEGLRVDPKNQRAYTGRSGQLAVMAELLARGCNVAIPEIDVGEDLFAFQDGQRAVDRIQVKAANGKTLKEPGSYAADVSVPLTQLRALDDPELYYVFPVRLDDLWTDFVIVIRPDLNALHENKGVGYENRKAGELQLHFTFGPVAALSCSGEDLQLFRNAWERLPVLKPLPQTAAGPSQTTGTESGPSTVPNQD